MRSRTKQKQVYGGKPLSIAFIARKSQLSRKIRLIFAWNVLAYGTDGV